MKKTLAALATLAFAGTASAGVLSFSDNFNFPLSPGSQVLQLQQFNTLGGTRVLKSVTIEINGSIQAHVTAENDSTIPGTMGISITGVIDALAPLGLAATASIAQAVPGVPVQPSDGVDGSGPDFHDFGMLTGNDTDSDTLGAPPFTPYLGGSTFSVTVNGSGGFSATGVTDSEVTVSDFRAFGTVTVRYDFNIVPVPGTAALLGLGGLVAARRRRA